MTILFMISAVTGIDKGIKWLSNANVSLCGILILTGLIIRPTVLIINIFTNDLGIYVSSIIRESLQIDPFSGDNSWYGGWTIFYWAWWIAWAPFVGTFIARISKW